MKCSHRLFLRVVTQVIEHFFSSLTRTENVLKLACDISKGGEGWGSLQKESHASSVELLVALPGLGTQHGHVRGEGQRAGSVTWQPHRACTRAGLHAEAPQLALMLCCDGLETLDHFLLRIERAPHSCFSPGPANCVPGPAQSPGSGRHDLTFQFPTCNSPLYGTRCILFPTQRFLLFFSLVRGLLQEQELGLFCKNMLQSLAAVFLGSEISTSPRFLGPF